MSFLLSLENSGSVPGCASRSRRPFITKSRGARRHEGTRLRQSLGGEVDDVESLRREVTGGCHGGLGPVRADGDPEWPIVDLNLHTRWCDRLSIGKQYAAVRLPSDKRDRDDCGDADRQRETANQHGNGNPAHVIFHDGQSGVMHNVSVNSVVPFRKLGGSLS
jgi:hypothetical protein